MNKMMLALVAIVAGLFLAGSAYASHPDSITAVTTEDETITVLVDVGSSCTFTSVDVDFGVYHAGDSLADRTATGGVSVKCTQGTGYDIALDGGLNPSTNRQMDDGGLGRMEYTVTSDDNTDAAWGNGTVYGAIVQGTGAGNGNAATAHNATFILADSTANRNAPAGSYDDTIAVTVSYTPAP